MEWITAAAAILGPLLALALYVLRMWDQAHKKTVLEKIDEKKKEFDLYIANGRYDQAAFLASNTLDHLSLLLRGKGKTSPK